MTDSATARLIEARLTRRLRPTRLELRDDSAKHVGHRGATSGGGHYHVLVVSAAFEGLDMLARHRAVNDALRDLFPAKIHALSMRTVTPAEWQADRSS